MPIWIQQRPITLFQALLVSLLLHLGLLAVPLVHDFGQAAGREADGILVATLLGVQKGGGERLPEVVVESSIETTVEKKPMEHELPVVETASEPFKPLSADSPAPKSPLSPPAVLVMPPDTPDPTRYFQRTELSRPPVLQTEPVLEVSDALKAAKVPLEPVVLRLYIDTNGLVERVEVLGDKSPSVFSEAAVAAFASMRFLPGEIASVAVKSQLLLEVDFDALLPGASRASGSQYLRGPPATVRR